VFLLKALGARDWKINEVRKLTKPAHHLAAARTLTRLMTLRMRLPVGPDIA
jgi:hypothetical protein